MYREVIIQSFFNGLTLMVVALSSLAIAFFLGPSDFGKYAGLQAIAAMLVPFATLRIETRIATCISSDHLSFLISSALTSVVIFICISLLIMPIIIFYFNWLLVLLITILAASSATLESLIACYSYQGKRWEIIKYRSFRLMFPSVVAVVMTYFFHDMVITLAALVSSSIICVAVLVWPMRWRIVLSLKIMCDVINKNKSGLKASVVLGGLNAVWLNSMLPLMNLMGLSSIAGQYAVAQRLMNAPLSVLSLSIHSLLLKKGNSLHKEGVKILIKVFLLFLVALVIALFLYIAIYIQSIIPFPERWKLDEWLFCTATFFLASSFSVGSVSILSIRLKDEWALAYWQLIFISIWVGILILFNSVIAFNYMLIIGGVGYWLLLIRWVLVSKEKVSV